MLDYSKRVVQAAFDCASMRRHRNLQMSSPDTPPFISNPYGDDFSLPSKVRTQTAHERLGEVELV